MLCASAFTTYDLFIFGNYKGRTFKWGYFPEYKEYDIDDLLRKKRTNSKDFMGRKVFKIEAS